MVTTTSTPRPDLPTQVSPPALLLSEDAVSAIEGVDVVVVPVLAPDRPDAGADAVGASEPAGHADPAAPATGDATTATGPLLGPGAAELAELLDLDLLALLELERHTGRVGEVVRVPVLEGTTAAPGLRQVLLLGVGDVSPTSLRRAGATLARAVARRSVSAPGEAPAEEVPGRRVATSIAALADDAGLEAFAVGVVLGSYGFHWRSSGPAARPAAEVVLAGCGPERAPALARAVAIGAAGWRARMLATVPSNLKSPAWLAEQAIALADEVGLEHRVWDEQQLAAEGFGGLLGVGQGSATPPRLIRLDYTPEASGRRGRRAAASAPTVVLVGKGITFDSGGLSIKPAEAMATMKRDMSGAGVVLATMAALRDVGCPVRVVGLLCCAENAVSGSSMRPGDVVRHYGGRTSEVTNTDAEGRLVLADGLAYAVAEIGPAALVDVATLTGAVKVALGQRTGGLFASDDALADALRASGESAGEPLWRLPLLSAYEDRLASPVADADNAAGGPGAITAALFLQHFTGGLPWAHLDLASVGDSPSESYEWSAGPSGFGARLLLSWLGSADPLAGVGAR
ncbi:leucyl aminopeptidase family protein [Nocardioides sp. TRM66260-LWL]|uniref:leucyl aminopeptidase family protein n=1 Tax=Nocardioides sp. TRM66260-LWL TaxID=2874478 RepID=UPI001CC5BDE0|nr:leucyl aminopeptidase family protein [Nocardioides sp. TRM66260-LWL]MBZ5735079.1 leucyl aminopeptidase family protein [Nocardioides sp. TRM66260-LWL]